MDETYIGWDGETYPSPPPEGWYKASDGRYWAPDSGPNPPPTGAGAAAAAATAPSAPTDAGASMPGDAQATSQFSAPPPAAGRGADGPTTDEQPMPGGPVGLAGAGPPAGGPPGFQPTTGPAGETSSGVSRLLLVGLGIVGAIVVVGGAIVFTQRGGGDDTAAEGTTTTVEGADEEAPDDEDAADATTTTADPDESASTTAVDESSTTTAAEPAGDPQAFRTILADNGLSSEQLTDEQIQDFGGTYCGFADLSETEEDFEDLRQSTIDEADSDLSDEGLGTIIDAAVIVFCPDQATRLNIDS